VGGLVWCGVVRFAALGAGCSSLTSRALAGRCCGLGGSESCGISRALARSRVLRWRLRRGEALSRSGSTAAEASGARADRGTRVWGTEASFFTAVVSSVPVTLRGCATISREEPFTMPDLAVQIFGYLPSTKADLGVQNFKKHSM
jgi:hypothetical protein